MKANAPEKIYIEVTPDGTRYYRDVVKEQRTENSDIEYIRTNAFIEKACAFLQDRIEHDSINYPMATHWLIEDFKKYMKGE